MGLGAFRLDEGHEGGAARDGELLEDGVELVLDRGDALGELLGDGFVGEAAADAVDDFAFAQGEAGELRGQLSGCLLYTSDAADE